MERSEIEKAKQAELTVTLPSKSKSDLFDEVTRRGFFTKCGCRTGSANSSRSSLSGRDSDRRLQSSRIAS